MVPLRWADCRGVCEWHHPICCRWDVLSTWVKNMKAAFIAAACVVLLAACAQNKNFVRPSSEALRLGESTYSDVVNVLGESGYRLQTGTINGETIQSIDYGYSEAAKFVGLNAPQRVLHLTFFKGVLIGEEYNRSFDQVRGKPRRLGRGWIARTA